MFILTNINVNSDSVKILDTEDMSNDVVNLSSLAKKIRSNKFKIYGLKRLQSNTRMDVIVIPQLGIVVDQKEAREALARFYIEKGVDKATAYKKAGLA